MKRICQYLIAIPLLFFFATPSPAQTPTHHVVIDMTAQGAEGWTGVLNNIENVQKAFGAATIEIESVSHGKGLGLLLKTNAEMRQRLEQAASRGVVFAACANTMRMQHVSKDDLFPFVKVVDSGVAEVVRKQEAGWSYLKVGQ